MSDIIQLLPDSVANQIAAGEVIQRPASVIKELVENSIDAGATEITVNITNAGKTTIQVIDNGKGMSETDARMAFERHATSKIKEANDLFKISSMGFRGEALASIAAVADVELKTKPQDNEFGTYIHIKGSEIQKQELISCNEGTNFIIKNIFFNIPARRKFLKKNTTEFQYIINEFQKNALAHPDISFTLIHNNTTIYKLPKTKLRQRIGNIFGKNISDAVIPVSSETSILKIYGYIGKPDIAKKTRKEQFFFANKRFMKHAYFYKAVQLAYDQIIKAELHPVFFLFFDIDASQIDINIHPAKIEINFENSQGVFNILRATIKEALGKHNIGPAIDFDREGEIIIPNSHKNKEIIEPQINIDPEYNPFDETQSESNKSNYTYKPYESKQKQTDNWDALFNDFESNTDAETKHQKTIVRGEEETDSKVLQIKNKYIITPVKSGLMIINQKRAHERILFEKFMNLSEKVKVPSQKSLYPIEIFLNPEDLSLLKGVFDELHIIGFILETKNDDTIIISGTPAHLTDINHKQLVEYIISALRDEPEMVQQNAKERIAEITARTHSINYGKKLATEEMRTLIDSLFASQLPNFTPSGKKIISIISYDDINKLF